MSSQITNKVVMIRPAGFCFNSDTAVNNVYQHNDSEDEKIINEKAVKEFDNFVEKLRDNGINVNVIQDTLYPRTPDSIFPNNWFSSHEEKLFLYPMFAQNRREESKKFKNDLIKIINNSSLKIEDYTFMENEKIFLEGTGSMVLDRVNKKAYCSLSERTDERLVKRFCENAGYKPIIFTSFQDGKEIYHTNVIMSIGEKKAMICFDCIEERFRDTIKKELLEDNKEIIEISLEQVKEFLGNTLELRGKNNKVFTVMSETAYNSLNKEQLEKIEKFTSIIYADVKTIEYYGGGSARCMIGEIF